MNNTSLKNMSQIEAVYGPPPHKSPLENREMLKGTNIIIVFIILALGIIALVNKKTSKKTKIIIISCLILIGVIITGIIYYLVKNI